MPDANWAAGTMEDVTFLDHSTVELDEFMGSDAKVVRAARASLKGAQRAVSHSDIPGLIGHMMKNRHGSVFEHATFTFIVQTPLPVAREFMRHRMASYNEISARYAELPPVFWIPPRDRMLRQEGKASDYHLVPGTAHDYHMVVDTLKNGAYQGYWDYQMMLRAGIAKEVARYRLPENTFTSFYVTFNARSLMNFLSLRVDDPDNLVPTHPLTEIQEVAREIEWHFGRRMPATYDAFVANGRVAP